MGLGRLIKRATRMIPAFVGYGMGGPFGAAITSGITSAVFDKGARFRNFLTSGAMSGLGSYAGDALGTRIGGFTNEVFGGSAGRWAAENLGSGFANILGNIGGYAGAGYGGIMVSNMLEKQRSEKQEDLAREYGLGNEILDKIDQDLARQSAMEDQAKREMEILRAQINDSINRKMEQEFYRNRPQVVEEKDPEVVKDVFQDMQISNARNRTRKKTINIYNRHLFPNETKRQPVNMYEQPFQNLVIHSASNSGQERRR